MAQLSLCGVKVTLSPFMPETSLPLMVVGPEPWSAVVGADGERERAAAVLHVDEELRLRVLDRVGRFDVSLAAVEGDGIASEIEEEAGGAGVLAGHAKAGLGCGGNGAHHAGEGAHDSGVPRVAEAGGAGGGGANAAMLHRTVLGA